MGKLNPDDLRLNAILIANFESMIDFRGHLKNDFSVDWIFLSVSLTVSNDGAVENKLYLNIISIIY